MFTLTSEKIYSRDGREMVVWEELQAGAPTLIAYARLCSMALAHGVCEPEKPLTAEALCILYAARRRGAIEIKGAHSAFESSERFLGICVELDSERSFLLKRRDDPELNIRFLEGFRQLCAAGLVMHHQFRDFSLTVPGLEWARRIDRSEVPILEKLADEQQVGEF